MTIVRQSRARLDKALGLPIGANDKVDFDSRANVVLLLAGAESSPARDLHDKAVAKVTLPWRKTFLITDLAILTQTERNKWFGSQGRYAVYQVDGAKTAAKGPVVDLQLKSGKPSITRIKGAFGKGEKA